MKRLLQPFYVAYVVLTFIISVLLSFPVIGIASLRNNRAARKWIHAYIRQWCNCWLFLIGMPIKVTGAQAGNRRVVVVVNHISYLDTLVIFPALGAYFRVLGMSEVAVIPLFGHIYKQVAILVDRSNPLSRTNSYRRMQVTLEREGSIVIFPEGGFNESGAVLKPFYDGAFRLALSAGVDILPLILPDTTRRWHYNKWYMLWPGRNRAIFLPRETIRENDTIVTLKQRVYDRMEAALMAANKA